MMADAWSNVKIPTILLPDLGRYDEDFETAIDDREKRCLDLLSNCCCAVH
jgi:hypothetical protein